MKIACLLATSLFLCTVSFARAANAQMVQRTDVPMQKVHGSFAAKEKAGKLSSEEKKLFILAKVGQDVVGLSSLSVPSSEREPVFQKAHFVAGINDAIKKDPQWKKQVAPAAVAMIRSESAVLEESFGNESYAWAWFQYQLGEKKRAKELLTSLYAEEFEKVMALKRVVYFGGSPLDAANALFQALEPMCEGQEKENVRDQLQKMKVHVSNLPDAHIKT